MNPLPPLPPPGRHPITCGVIIVVGAFALIVIGGIFIMSMWASGCNDREGICQGMGGLATIGMVLVSVFGVFITHSVRDDIPKRLAVLGYSLPFITLGLVIVASSLKRVLTWLGF